MEETVLAKKVKVTMRKGSHLSVAQNMYQKCRLHLDTSGTAVLLFWIEDHVPIKQIKSKLLTSQSY